MASNEMSFPKIPSGNWWKLRALFKKRVPAVVTPTYLATALSMAERSASANIISPFRKIGIIDDDGKPTDLAYDWRDDEKYSDVCNTLIESCYPQEIKDLFSTPDADPQQLTNWFMSQARCGEQAARHFTRFYMLLLKADLSEAEEASAKDDSKSKKPRATRTTRTSEPNKAKKSGVEAPQQTETREPPATVNRILNRSPELHINIQLHISPESSADQIDKIFESMAKHLKDFNN